MQIEAFEELYAKYQDTENHLVDVVMLRGFSDLTIPKWKVFLDLKDNFDKKRTQLFIILR